MQNRIEAMLAEALIQYGSEIDDIRSWERHRMDREFFGLTGMFDWLEAQVLYLLIRLTKPEVIIEVGSNYGYTTGFMLMALNKNDFGQFYSSDLEEIYYEKMLKNFDREGIDSSKMQFLVGDICGTYKQIKPKKFDILFMDAEHDTKLAKWYVPNLFPRVIKGGLIQVHDVLRAPDMSDVSEAWGERRVIWDFIQEKQIPEIDFLYLNEFLRDQSDKSEVLQQLQQYPVHPPEHKHEKCYSLWLVKHF